VSRQRAHHLGRQPTEEAIRLAVSALVGPAGTVDVQRMSYDFRADDVLIQAVLQQPISGETLASFRKEVARTLRDVIPSGDPLEDWLVVIESGGEVLARVAPYDKLEESSDEWRDET
jgi:hypothetical protein